MPPYEEEDLTPGPVSQPQTVGERLLRLEIIVLGLPQQLQNIRSDMLSMRSEMHGAMTKEECAEQRKVDHPREPPPKPLVERAQGYFTLLFSLLMLIGMLYGGFKFFSKLESLTLPTATAAPASHKPPSN